MVFHVFFVPFQVVTFKDESVSKLTLVDYLSIPPPRTLQLASLGSTWSGLHSALRAVKELLAEQYGLDPERIKGIDFYNGLFQRFQ